MNPSYAFRYCEIPCNNQIIRGSCSVSDETESVWVIFCHGFTGQRMGPGYLFVKIARELASIGVSTIRFDFRGSGESDGLFADMSVTTMRQDLHAVNEYLQKSYKPKKIILFGHSFGGMIAALCAGNIVCDGLILLSPVANPLGLVERRKSLIDAGPNESGFYENGPHEMKMSFLQDLQGVQPIAELDKSNFKAPVLLIQGDQDLSISVQESAAYAEWAKNKKINIEYHVLEGADHNYSQVPFVKKVNSLLCTWTKEHFK